MVSNRKVYTKASYLFDKIFYGTFSLIGTAEIVLSTLRVISHDNTHDNILHLLAGSALLGVSYLGSRYTSDRREMSLADRQRQSPLETTVQRGQTKYE